MKTTTILFLGLALMSFSASAQDSMFNDFGTAPQVETQAEEHALMGQDRGFLSDVERIRKNITFMQLELKEKELEYKVMEQAKKLDDLENTVVIGKESCNQKVEMPSIFGQLAPVQNAEEEEEAAPAQVFVTSIKGLKDDLKATVVSDDIGESVVGVGDVLNNGYKVVSVSKSAITLENTDGDIETIGITFKM